MQMEGQFSSSIWRRSYRSSDVGYYASSLVHSVARWTRWCYYGISVQEMLTYEHDWVAGYVSYLALEIRRENQEVIDLLKEAILGENQQVLLSRVMIQAIIRSGHEEMIDLLLKLLVAARLQEGLRQAILESADEGSTQTLIKILKTCLDEDLFRYSSATRAFDTWTGLGYGDAKSAVVKKCAEFAYTCLTDEQVRKQYLDSENNLEAYFAIWSMGCYEIRDTENMVRRLLDDEKKYRRVLGWLFVSRTDSTNYQMRLASSYLEERDEELLAWMISNLVCTYPLMSGYSYNRKNWECTPTKNDALPSSAAERKILFEKLKAIAEFIGNKKRTFEGNPFAFTSVTMENTPVLKCMLSVAGYDMNQEMIEEMHTLLPLMDVDLRRAFYANFMNPEKIMLHREYLQEALEDRSVHVKELAVQRLSVCDLLEEDFYALAKGLRTKSSSLRKAILTIFQKQSVKKEHPEVLEEQKSLLEHLKEEKLSTQTEILLEQLYETEDAETTQYTQENGFGIYSPNVTESVVSQLPKIEGKPAGILGRLLGKTDETLFSAKELKEYFPSEAELSALLERMNAVFDRHADYEYEIILYDDSRTKVLFGDPAYGGIRIPAEHGKFINPMMQKEIRLEMIPFYQEFIQAMGEYTRNLPKMLGLCYSTARWTDGGYYNLKVCGWFQQLLDKGLRAKPYPSCYEKYKNRYWQMQDIIRLLPQLFDAHDCFVMAGKFQKSIIHIIGEENLKRNYVEQMDESRVHYISSSWQKYPINHVCVGYWRRVLSTCAKSPEDFKQWFLEKYFRAVDEGIVPKDVLAERLLCSGTGETDIRILTGPNKFNQQGKRIYDTYPWAKAFVDRIVLRIVEIEEKRGELPTNLTSKARAIQRFEGAGHFCSLLAALGKENFFRGYEYSQDNTKKAVLSRLLKRCYPTKEDAPEILADYLKKTDIKEKRLAEAVMYAPQWAAFAEEILQWPGLKCAVWFFHAHINESFSAEKETEVALYSPITPHQFNDGAFDKDWFFKAYTTLGEKRFQILYKSAKYITAGSNQHRRSQLYSDAVLGKLDASVLKEEIIQKRNQEKLRCYPLIPIEEGQTEEALRRYEFLQKFLKEKIRPLMEPQDVNGVQLWVEIGADGMAELAIAKGEKRQKTLPKALNKNETVLLLKATVKELKEQRRRAKESLERAMVESTAFGVQELLKIQGNPVLAPLLSVLVWNCQMRNGFLKAEEGELLLCDIHGNAHKLTEEVRVAHPYDLMQSGEWAAYMQLLYGQKIVQPFKQVFREYYPLTREEREEKTVSRRYAGHQVQPQKTVALLKGRGWTVDYEEGLQKVFYKENLVVRMYAMADWFSPADIEAPTLEIIKFYDRNDGKNVELESIPPILFSETMRDMDLAVSVAHAGGVDPEASHSTVEMRVAIAGELLKLLRISNVVFTGSHAKIHGTLGEYSVHMGSGVVHVQAKGMAAIIPVHSQARGRIFLPFADDDPKTQEIISKILLLAEDKKIKDPEILRQLQ